MIEDTIEQLRGLVAERLDVNLRPEDISPDAALLGDGLSLESLAIVELITLTEQRFDIEFGEDDLNMESFASLRSLANIIVELRQRAERQSPAVSG
jgi:acyl carrier protein